jgi:membrane-associated HD superfamily phosphohydrolase
MEYKTNSPKDVKKAIELVEKSNWENKDELIKALEKQYEGMRITKAFDAELTTPLEKQYKMGRELIASQNIAEDVKQKQLDVYEDQWGAKLDAEQVRKDNRINERNKQINDTAEVITKAAEAYVGGVISEEKRKEIDENAVLALDLKLKKLND